MWGRRGRSAGTMSPRSYDAPQRRADAEATRTRILEAARALIGGKGDLEGFSMETVARKAGVSRMTVYYQFQSKAGLLEALADHLAARGGMSRLRLAFTEADPEVALRRLVETFVRFWASDRMTLRRLRAMAVVSPSASAGPRNRDAWRREAVATIAGRFAGRRRVPESVIDLLTTLTGFETYDALAGAGRSSEEIERTVFEAALRLLHGP